jgi:hypothetical protein
LNSSHLELASAAPVADSADRVFRGTRKNSRVEVEPAGAIPDESLEVDERASVSPAQAIESKLTRLLDEAWVPISHLLVRAMVRNR